MAALNMPSSLSPGVLTRCAAVGLAIEPQVLALVRGSFPIWRASKEVRGGVPRGAVGRSESAAPRADVRRRMLLARLVDHVARAADLGFGRIVASDIEVPIITVGLL